MMRRIVGFGYVYLRLGQSNIPNAQREGEVLTEGRKKLQGGERG